MNLLCLDTSTNHASCAIGDENGQLYVESVELHDRQLSVRLYPMLEQLLTAANLNLQDIDVLGVGIGPGSFTGVRVAVTTMRTLAQATRKSLVAVNTLDIYARAVRRGGLAGGRPFCVLLPSRRNEVYSAVYGAGSMADSISTASYDEIRQLCGRPDAERACAGPSALLDLVFPERAASESSDLFIEMEAPDPAALLAAAAEEARGNRFQDPLSLDPMYVALPAVSQHKHGVAGHSLLSKDAQASADVA